MTETERFCFRRPVVNQKGTAGRKLPWVFWAEPFVFGVDSWPLTPLMTQQPFPLRDSMAQGTESLEGHCLRL